MNQEESQPIKISSSPKSDEVKHMDGKVADCCKKTIDLLSKNNPMMVCQHCKHMIKVFSEEAAFNNYVRFCDSRHRAIIKAQHNGLWVVIYQAFHGFGR